MNIKLTVIVAVLFTIALSACNKNKVSKVPLPEGYYEDVWDEPLTSAQENDRKIFVQFYADWCSLCADFKEEVLNDSEVEAYINANFIGVLLDSENGIGKDIFEQNNLSGHPMSAMFDQNGAMLASHRGKMTKAEFLSWVRAHE